MKTTEKTTDQIWKEKYDNATKFWEESPLDVKFQLMNMYVMISPSVEEAKLDLKYLRRDDYIPVPFLNFLRLMSNNK